MDSQNTTDNGTGQASLTESWNERDPNPNNSLDETNEPDSSTEVEFDSSTNNSQDNQTPTSQPAVITQGSRSVVSSDGVVLPFTRSNIESLETEESEEQTSDDSILADSQETTSDDRSSNISSSQNNQVKTRQQQVETDEEKSSSETSKTPMKPLSSHAKNAAEQTKETDSSETSQKEITSQTSTPTADDIVEQSCPECHTDTVTKGTDQFCPNCGILLADQKIDLGPEWRAFNNSQKESRSRVGGPIKKNIHDKGLSTVIGNDTTDANGQSLSAAKQKKMSRLRKWDSRFKVKNTKERNLRQAFGEIQRLSSEMNLPEYVEETGCTVYRRALNEELLPGRSIEAIASASVYIAIRQAGIPKTLDTLNDFCRVDEARVTGAYSYLARELGMEIEPPDVLEYINRIASELEVTKQTERMAEKLLQTSVDEKIHSGKAPSGLAAAAMYAATLISRSDRVTQEDAADAGDVCPLTIRTRHRELMEAYGVDHKNISPPSQGEVQETRNKMNDETSDVEAIEANSPVISAD